MIRLTRAHQAKTVLVDPAARNYGALSLQQFEQIFPDLARPMTCHDALLSG